jgi:hypothetical protein
MALDVRRVLARFILATGIPLGKTVEVGSARIHRYRDHFKVTDLTNAGKRGKRVRVMNLSPSDSYSGKPEDWMESMGRALPEFPSYDGIKRFIKDVLVDSPGEITLNEFEERGVDVNPGGTVKIEMVTSEGVEITALPDDFTVRSSFMIHGKSPSAPANDTGREMWQDTLYHPAGKKDAQVFYNWLSANEAEAKRMGIKELRKLWGDLGVRYDFH